MGKIKVRKDVYEEMIEKGFIRDFSNKVERTINYFRLGVPVTRKQWVNQKKANRGIRRNPFGKKSNPSEEQLEAQEKRIQLLNTAPDIGEIKPLEINIYNYETVADREIKRQKKELHDNKPLCVALNKNVTEMKESHIKKDNGHLRDWEDLKHHIPYLPFISKVVKNGILNPNANLGKGRYEILARATIKTKNGEKRIGLAVQLGDSKKDNGLTVTEISIYNVIDNKINKKINGVIKSLTNSGCAMPETSQMDKSRYLLYSNDSKHRHNFNISQTSNLSSKNVIKSLTYSGHKLQGRTRLYGMDISIENKKGSYRSGTDKDGHKWRTYMNYDYGYIRGTEGVDSDQVDIYIGPDKEAQKVYVIHQNDPVTHKYDEDKCMLCFSSAADAKKAYMKQYDRPGFYGSMTTMTIDQFKSFIFSKKGKMIHKSFDIQITDITENNKQQKLEQFNKALNAIADNRPFVIKHIPADGSQRYENLTVRLMDFDRSKIEKAVHKVALSLDADISGASKGESFVYKSQEEIVDNFFREFTNRTRAVYNFVISYFDLPDIRIVSKAGELKYKGKILYNPETGKPIKESEWKRFIVELEKFLNRNYTGMGEKIVLSAESLGIILERLSKTNSLEAIRKMSVSDLKAKRYDVDWISDSVKNMKDKFGEVISRERQARIQIACDSAAQRVTRVKDDMRNNIQQIIIDGIRDKQSKSVVAQNLFDKCASLNRDMQRIADSEVQMASNSSYCKEEVYNSEPGSKVYFKRFEMIDDNTCKQCKKLNGTIVLWSDVPLPDEHIKDPFAKYAIWEGKNEGSCPVGIVHPYCRGTWVRYYPDLD